MFTTNYYCLVAGLKEYSLDADTKGFDAKAIVGEILEGVDGADADAVRLLYGYYDCENIASLRAGRSAHNPLGNLTREELEEELKECLFCLHRNEMMFDLEVDTDLIEQHIYERQALLLSLIHISEPTRPY